jgi:ABC-type lipoprotein release transport system permease subunit
MGPDSRQNVPLVYYGLAYFGALVAASVVFGRIAFVIGLFVVPFLLILALLVVVGLQAAGVLKRVPFSYNHRNLVVRWKVTLLTGLAFTLVVGLMTVMLAFVNGMYRLTGSSGRPENVLVMADGATDELFSNMSFGDVTEIEHSRPTIAKDDKGKALVSWEVYLVVNQPIAGADEGTVDPSITKGKRKRRFIQVRGVEDPVRSGAVHRLNLHSGSQWFSGAGSQSLPDSKKGETAVQAVLGEGIAREMGRDIGKKSLEVGDTFDLGPSKWIVVGILQSAGSTFDSEVWAKRSLAGDLFGKTNVITTAVLQATDAEAAQELAKDLTDNFKKTAVQAQVETKYYEKLNTTNDQFLVAIIFVVVVMAIGGVFGVMNTMFAAISQRTKDIGVLRILGYSRWQVLVSFFLESLLLALVGGVLGCAIGSVCHGWTATSIMSSGAGGGKSVVLKLAVDARILGAGLLFSLWMGCIGGFFPALLAMRLKPLESLR